jgi:hypothetical protein
MALPQGSGYPLYLLWRTPPQKDIASIPNANTPYQNDIR